MSANRTPKQITPEPSAMNDQANNLAKAVELVRGLLCGADTTPAQKELIASCDAQLLKGLETLGSCMLDYTKPIENPPALLSIMGQPMLLRQDISVVFGRAGSRKTYFCAALAKAYLDNAQEGTITCTSNPGGKVLWIDTENPAHRCTKRVRAVTMVKNNDFVVFRMRGVYQIDRFNALKAAVMFYRPALVVVDGLADMVVDVNDLAECEKVVQELAVLCEQFDTHFICVIHANETDTTTSRARGHIGSVATRKVSTTFKVEVIRQAKGTDEASTIEIPKHNESLSVPRLVITLEDASAHDLRAIVEPDEGQQAYKPTRSEKAAVDAVHAFFNNRNEKTFKKAVIVEGIKEGNNVGSSAAYNYIKTAIEAGLLEPTPGQKDCLTYKGKP